MWPKKKGHLLKKKKKVLKIVNVRKRKEEIMDTIASSLQLHIFSSIFFFFWKRIICNMKGKVRWANKRSFPSESHKEETRGKNCILWRPQKEKSWERKQTNKHGRWCFLANAKLNIILESKQKPLRHLVETLENNLWLNNSALFLLFFEGYFYKIKIVPSDVSSSCYFLCRPLSHSSMIV